MDRARACLSGACVIGMRKLGTAVDVTHSQLISMADKAEEDHHN